MTILLPIVGYFILGILARRWISDVGIWVKWINYFIIYVFFPAIILNKVPSLLVTPLVLIPAAVAWAWAGLAILLVLVLARFLQLPRETTGALLILTSMGNTSFLGFALTQSIFGDATLGYAIFYDQFGSFFILSTVGLILVARYAPQKDGTFQAPTTMDMVRRIVSFPPFVALCLSLLLPIDQLVVSIAPTLTWLGALLVPFALFVIGLQFQPRLLPHHRQPLALAIMIKMVLAPIVVLALFEVLSVQNEIRSATVFEAAMPSMITPGLLAISAGIAPRFIATTLGYGAIFAFISLPIVVWILL